MLGNLPFPVGLRGFSDTSDGKKGSFSGGYKSVTADDLETDVLASMLKTLHSVYISSSEILTAIHLLIMVEKL